MLILKRQGSPTNKLMRMMPWKQVARHEPSNLKLLHLMVLLIALCGHCQLVESSFSAVTGPLSTPTLLAGPPSSSGSNFVGGAAGLSMAAGGLASARDSNKNGLKLISGLATVNPPIIGPLKKTKNNYGDRQASAGEIADFINEMNYDLEQNILDEELEKGLMPFLDKINGVIKKLIAPEVNYIQLIRRYRRWSARYKAVQKSLEGQRQLKNSDDLLKEEYAKVDEALVAEQCRRDEEEGIPEEERDNCESMDFVLKVLGRLIDRLEQLVTDLEAKEGFVIDEVALTNAIESTELEGSAQDNARLKKAMARVKATVLMTATNVFKREALKLAKITALNTAAVYLAQQSPGRDQLGYLNFAVSLLGGSASVPIILSYLRDLELRGAVTLIGRLNPLGYIQCKWNALKQERDSHSE